MYFASLVNKVNINSNLISFNDLFLKLILDCSNKITVHDKKTAELNNPESYVLTHNRFKKLWFYFLIPFNYKFR